MISKYSLYFANLASLFILVLGYLQGVSFAALVIRTVAVFFLSFFVGNILGVITLETLLDSQLKKIEQERAMINEDDSLEEE
jgi:hypothetical protein